MGIVSEEINRAMEADIFDKSLRTRAHNLYQALFARRTALNKQKSQLLKSNFRHKATQAYADSLTIVKEQITFLTININKVDTMVKKNIIDSDLLDKIEIEYKKQL